MLDVQRDIKLNKSELNRIFQDRDYEKFSENTQPIFSATNLYNKKGIVFDIHDNPYDRSVYECRVMCFKRYHDGNWEWHTPNNSPNEFPYNFYISKKRFYEIYKDFTIIYFPPNCRITKVGLIHIEKNQTLKQKIKRFFFPNISYR